MDLDQFIRTMQVSPRNQCFYHFTDARNLPSIRQHGLLSAQVLDLLSISVAAPGGNELSRSLDRTNGMDGYVHLCFDSNHPMEFAARQDGRIQSCHWLRIAPSVIKLPGVLVTAEVANKTGVVPGKPQDLLGTLDLAVIYARADWNDPIIRQRLQAARRYEILVPRSVAANYITF
jgi:hypothetical protein